jgi:hypothetical protein
MAVFGKNILENLTTGMYSDRRMMFREYVQNSCDAIDTAVKKGILKLEDARIDITIDENNSTIVIEDNGYGISTNDFVRVLSDIANSDKSRNEDKGFRGIGRLCGLAYCTQMQFIASTLGEDKENIMVWDAKKMRGMLNDNKKRTADEVLVAILSLSKAPSSKESHYFKVIMTGINKDSHALLDVNGIRDYLSFEAPVPYDSAFMFYRQILDHACKLGVKIDEYPIYTNDEQIFKPYRTRIYASGKIHDEIMSIDFKDFYDQSDNLIGWMWFGLSSFNGQIKSENIQRGIRLRKGNIQIGSSRALRDRRLFPDPRANEYFIGEVFALHPDLIPNARRDYFNENTVRTTFELQLTEFFKVLWKLCNVASDDRSAYKSIRDYHSAVETYHDKEKSGFAGGVERETLDSDLENKQKLAENAQKQLERSVGASFNDNAIAVQLIQKVKTIVSKVEGSKTPNTLLPSLQTGSNFGDTKRRQKTTPKFLSGDLSQYTRETRKVVSRIYDIINQNAPEMAEELISKIQTALKSKKE